MSGVAKEWAVVLFFLFAVVGLTILEAFLISRKGWAGFGKSLAFSVLTNLIGFTGGFIVLFVVLAFFMAMAWDGSIKRFPLHDYGIWTVLIAAVLFFPLFLLLWKRLFLRIFSIQAGKTAWLFSTASSFAIFIISYGLPICAVYLLS
jgi:hypothetical protein